MNSPRSSANFVVKYDDDPAKVSTLPLAIDVAAVVVAALVIIVAVVALVILKAIDFFKELRTIWK
jgi:hypothetical protein